MNSLFRGLLSGLVVFFALILFYSTVFSHEFAYHNDYRIFDYETQRCCFGYPESPSLFAIGRPILVLLLNIHLFFITDMRTLGLGQIFSVLMISFFASICAIYFQREFRITVFGSIVLSILIFTLPAMIVNSFWITNFVSQILTLFISLFAYLLFQSRNSGFKRSLAVLGGFSLLMVTLLIYPPSAMFFVSLTFIKLFFGPKLGGDVRLRDVVDEIVVVIAACALYFILIKFLWLPFLIQSNHLFDVDWLALIKWINQGSPENEFSIATIGLLKLVQVQEFLMMVFSSWFEPGDPLIFFPTAIFFFFSMAWAAKESLYFGKFRTVYKMLFWMLLAVLVAVLTGIPVLAGPSSYKTTYRAIFPSMIIVPVAVVFFADRIYTRVIISKGFVQEIGISILILISGVIVAAEISSLNRLGRVVEYSSAEFQHVYNALSRDVSERTKEIRVETPMIQPLSPRPFRDLGLSGEHMDGLVKAVLIKIGLNPNNFAILMNEKIYSGSSDEAVVVTAVPKGTAILTNSLIIGEWNSQGKIANIIYKDGLIYCVNELGVSSKAQITGLKKLLVSEWGVFGTLSMDGRELQWSNGSSWTR